MTQFEQFVAHHWILWLALVVVIGLIVLNEWLSQKNHLRQITPQTAVDLINNHNAVVIDIRDKEAYRRGHIIDAIWMNTADIDEKKLEIHQGKPIILVSNEAQLSNLPLAFEIKHLSMNAWINASFPVVKDK